MATCSRYKFAGSSAAMSGCINLTLFIFVHASRTKSRLVKNDFILQFQGFCRSRHRSPKLTIREMIMFAWNVMRDAVLCYNVGRCEFERSKTLESHYKEFNIKWNLTAQ